SGTHLRCHSSLVNLLTHTYVSCPLYPLCCSFFFSTRRLHTMSVSAFLLNRSSDLIMSQVTEQSVRFQTALASIKLIQASAVLDLTEDDFDFLTSNKVWIATDRSRARRCVEAC